jgi:hypothetical protein
MTRFGIVILLALPTLSCSGRGPTAPDAVSTDHSVAAASSVGSLTAKDQGQVPFRARLSGTSDLTFLSSTEVLENFSGTGNATHLGSFIAEQEHKLNLLTGEVLQGIFTFTAANGDTVFGTYGGLGTPLPSGLVQFKGSFTIDGGTGRFSEATGEGDCSGVIDPSGFPTSATATLALDGTISSPGQE